LGQNDENRDNFNFNMVLQKEKGGCYGKLRDIREEMRG
jgi:hypothetical protein